MQNQAASSASGSVGEQLNSTQTQRYRGWVASGVSALSSSLVNQMSVGSTTVNVKQGEAESKFSPLQGNSVVSGLGIQGVNPHPYAGMCFPSVAFSGRTFLSIP